jgi:DNA-binding NarL/FixJ family response regulator
MAAGFNTCGGSYLARKSKLVHARAGLVSLDDILLIEDESLDAERLTATLRVLFGYEIQIRWAATLGDAIDAVMAKKPNVVFLDDILKPSANASQAIPLLRDAGYAGPIIVVSGQVTYPRRSGLLADGASDVIHKDDIDSVRVAEALARLFVSKSDAAPGP